MSDPSVQPIVSRRIAIVAVIGLTIVSGLVHGSLRADLGRTDDFQQIGQQLAELPKRCGDWVAIETLELPESADRMLRCYGSEVRVYRNEKTGAAVNAFVLFGPRGPIAVHTPEICFASVGTKQVGEARARAVQTGDRSHQLWSVQFSQDSLPVPTVEVWWGWSEGGPWQASQNPRFGLTENLYKIQIAGPVSDETRQPCREFLEAFLPHVERVIQ